MTDPGRKNRELFAALLFSAAILIYFCFWIRRLYPTLINDEYSALDFIYRWVKTGELAIPPHRFYKPYSLILGLFVFAGGPLGFELTSAVFAALLVFAFFLCARQRLSFGFAFLSMLMLGFAPDLFDNTVQAIVMVPGTFFIVLGVYFGAKMVEQKELWKGYAVAGFLGGLARPENWLLAFPLAYWLFPKNRREFFRWAFAGGLISLSALVWFGKDWFLHHDLLYSLGVARYDKMISTGAYFGLWKSLSWFNFFLSKKFSLPFEILCLLGWLWYAWDHRRKIARDPLLIIPAIMFLFLYLSIWRGLYPQMRFFFPVSVFMIFYAGYLIQRLWQSLKARGYNKLAWGLVVLILCEYFTWAGFRLGSVELKALNRESELQKQTIQLAEYFRPILKNHRYRILIPDRRDDEFSWLLRDLPFQDYFHFREVFYYAEFKGKDFLSFEPDWIVWLPNDFQYNRVNDMFQWLSYQDRTELSNHLITLEAQIGSFRIFRVTRIGPASP